MKEGNSYSAYFTSWSLVKFPAYLNGKGFDLHSPVYCTRIPSHLDFTEIYPISVCEEDLVDDQILVSLIDDMILYNGKMVVMGYEEVILRVLERFETSRIIVTESMRFLRKQTGVMKPERLSRYYVQYGTGKEEGKLIYLSDAKVNTFIYKN